ncbi:hypothetical protein D3C79_1084120 [compost metagenome]
MYGQGAYGQMWASVGVGMVILGFVVGLNNLYTWAQSILEMFKGTSGGGSGGGAGGGLS